MLGVRVDYHALEARGRLEHTAQRVAAALAAVGVGCNAPHRAGALLGLVRVFVKNGGGARDVKFFPAVLVLDERVYHQICSLLGTEEVLGQEMEAGGVPGGELTTVFGDAFEADHDAERQ